MSIFSVKSIEIDGLRLDCRHRRGTVNGADLYLNAGEFDLLARLAGEPGNVATANELIAEAFGSGVGVTPETIWRAVERVKRKLELRGMPDVLERVAEDGIRFMPFAETCEDAGPSDAALAEAV